jgi:hypothetical protein
MGSGSTNGMAGSQSHCVAWEIQALLHRLCGDRNPRIRIRNSREVLWSPSRGCRLRVRRCSRFFGMNDGKLLTLITARRRDDAVMLSRTELVPAKVFRTAELPGRACGRLRRLCRLFGVEPISVVGTGEDSQRGELEVVNSIASCFARFINRGGAKS